MSSLSAVASTSLYNSNLYANGIPPASVATQATTTQATTAQTAAAATTQLASTTTNFLTSAVQLATDTNFQLQLLAQGGNLYAQEILSERTAASKLLNPGTINLLA